MSEIEYICSEEWRPVPIRDLSGLYLVSDAGQIYSRRAGRIMVLTKNRFGYMTVMLSSLKRTRFPLKVHRIVASAFIGPCPSGYQCNHINGVKNDNRAHNLEWVTPSENAKHAFYVLGNESNHGEKNGRAKLKEPDIHSILNLLKDGTPKSEISRRFGVHRALILKIQKGTAWARVSSAILARAGKGGAT